MTTTSKVIKKELANFPFLDNPLNIYTLENGHTIVIAKKEGELVNISTWVKTGSINEDDKINGISHFLEHLMFKGTPTHPAGDFDRILESKGGIVNAATWKDYTFYYVTIPVGKNREDYKLTLELHADMMLNSTVPDEEIGPEFDFANPEVEDKRERYVVIEEIRMRDDQPWTKTYNQLNHAMYTNHPYKRDVIGEPEIIASIPRQEILDYYHKWYTPNNFTTIVVGDIAIEDTLNDIQNAFIFKSNEHTVAPDYEIDAPPQEQKVLELTGNINTGFIMFGYHGPKASNIKDTIALDVIADILGDGKSSRLYHNLIEKPDKPIFNIIDSDQYQFKDGNNFFIQGNFNPDCKEEAIESIRKEVIEIMNNEVSNEEFDKAKTKLKSQFATESETVSSIAETIGYYMTVCGDISACTKYIPTLESLTKQDIIEAAKKYLDLNKATISLYMPDNTSEEN